jgi:hypothetical protein
VVEMKPGQGGQQFGRASAQPTLHRSEYYGSMAAGSIVGATRSAGAYPQAHNGHAHGGPTQAQSRSNRDGSGSGGNSRSANGRREQRASQGPRLEHGCRASLVPHFEGLAFVHERSLVPLEQLPTAMGDETPFMDVMLEGEALRKVWLVLTTNALTVYDTAARQARLVVFSLRRLCAVGPHAFAALGVTARFHMHLPPSVPPPLLPLSERISLACATFFFPTPDKQQGWLRVLLQACIPMHGVTGSGLVSAIANQPISTRMDWMTAPAAERAAAESGLQQAARAPPIDPSLPGSRLRALSGGGRLLTATMSSLLAPAPAVLSAVLPAALLHAPVEEPLLSHATISPFAAVLSGLSGGSTAAGLPMASACGGTSCYPPTTLCGSYPSTVLGGVPLDRLPNAATVPLLQTAAIPSAAIHCSSSLNSLSPVGVRASSIACGGSGILGGGFGSGFGGLGGGLGGVRAVSSIERLPSQLPLAACASPVGTPAILHRPAEYASPGALSRSAGGSLGVSHVGSLIGSTERLPSLPGWTGADRLSAIARGPPVVPSAVLVPPTGVTPLIPLVPLDAQQMALDDDDDDDDGVVAAIAAVALEAAVAVVPDIID